MKISKIIKQLEKLEKEYGDVELYIQDHTAPFDNEIEVDFPKEQAKFRENHLIFYK